MTVGAFNKENRPEWILVPSPNVVNIVLYVLVRWCQNGRALYVAHHFPGWSVLSTVVHIVVLSVVTVSEYPLPLFVPDSLSHYWSCTGCHRRINSGHCSPGVDIRVSPPPLLLFQHNRVMGLVITRSCCSFSHTTLLLLNKYTSSILSSPLLIISLASAVTF